MSSRRRIEAVAKRLGFEVLSLTYTPVASLEMGDGAGGWLLKTQRGDFGGTAEWVVSEMEEQGGQGEK